MEIDKINVKIFSISFYLVKQTCSKFYIKLLNFGGLTCHQ